MICHALDLIDVSLLPHGPLFVSSPPSLSPPSAFSVPMVTFCQLILGSIVCFSSHLFNFHSSIPRNAKQDLTSAVPPQNGTDECW